MGEIDYSLLRIKTQPYKGSVHSDKGDIVDCPDKNTAVFTHGAGGCVSCEHYANNAPYESGYIHCHKAVGKPKEETESDSVEAVLARARENLKKISEPRQ